MRVLAFAGLLIFGSVLLFAMLSQVMLLAWLTSHPLYDDAEAYRWFVLFSVAFIAVLLAEIVLGVRLWRRWFQRPTGFCEECGYCLTGLLEPRCPECGGATEDLGKNDCDMDPR